MNKIMNRFLGIDYGKAKVGLSVADEETGIAFAFGMIPNDKDFLVRLLEIIRKEEITRVIIGIPSYKNRKDEKYDGEELGEYLEKNGIEIAYHDEMFSTKMAQDNLKEKGARNVGRADDAEAAKIILQSWLDKQNQK